MKINLWILTSLLVISGCSEPPRTIVKDGVVYEEKDPGRWTARKDAVRRSQQNNRVLRY